MKLVPLFEGELQFDETEVGFPTHGEMGTGSLTSKVTVPCLVSGWLVSFGGRTTPVGAPIAPV